MNAKENKTAELATANVKPPEGPLGYFKEGWERCEGAIKDRHYGSIQRFFVCIPAALDWVWRLLDFKYSRGFGGLFEKRTGIRGYSGLVLLLPALLLFFIVHGPAGGLRGLLGIELYVVSLAGLWAGCRLFSARGRVLPFQIAWLLVIGAVVWFCAGPQAREGDGGLYRHILVPFVFVLLLLMIPAAVWFSSWLFSDDPDFRPSQLLPEVELFQRPTPPDISLAKVLRSFVTALMIYPIHIFFFPSLVVLLLPNAYSQRLNEIAIAVFALTWMLYSFANIHARFRAMLNTVDRTFFHGAQLLVSVGIIGLALGRLTEFGYVATVVESAGSRVFLYLVSSYVVLWFYTFWIDRLLAEQFLKMLGGTTNAPVPYPINPQAISTRVKADGRVIQSHGGARLIVIGQRDPEGREVFHLYDCRELIDRLVDRFPFKSLPERELFQSRAKEVRRNVHFYHGTLNLTLAAIVVIAAILLSRFPQVPTLNVTASVEPDHLVNLQQLLFTTEQPRNKVILLAASGGGTRAALYTASILHGLAALGALPNVRLASGISGGSAALAYFASHRQELATNNPAPWRAFYEAMSQPFIMEVLLGASEWRITTGTRWGKLLSESFERHLDTPGMLTHYRDLGLIFNSSLAGHLHTDCSTNLHFSEWMESHRQLTRSDQAGSRLIFTNLREAQAFPVAPADEPYQLHFVTLQNDRIPVTTAASITANFPPVFANAAVDVVQGADRYWVTDGGAVENRGIISLLLALRQAVQAEVRHPPGRSVYPDIHIIIADASAASIDYHQDRGIGSKFGASEKFASELMNELTHQIRYLYGQVSHDTNKVHLHYLAMPVTLRTRGGLGTHWMLPEFVRFSDPQEKDPARALASSKVVSAFEVMRQISLLHQTNSVFDRREISENLLTVHDWIQQDPVHHRCWTNLVAAFR